MTFPPWLNADFVEGYLTSQRWGEGGWLGRNRFLLCGNIVCTSVWPRPCL